MAKATRKKSAKKVKQKVRKPVKKKTAKKVVSRKKTTKSSPRKKTVPRKKSSKKTTPSKKGKSSKNALNSLDNVLSKILTHISEVKKTNQSIQKKIDHKKDAMFKTDDLVEKLTSFFDIEGMKISSYSEVEGSIKSVSNLLDEAYKHSYQVGGIIRDDFLNICSDLSKELHIEKIEKDIKKMRKDIAKQK